MLSKALEMGVCFYRGPALGTKEGRFSPWAFERRKKFLYLGKFYEEFERYVKKPCKRAALFLGVQLEI
jgi:hypothetical protein